MRSILLRALCLSGFALPACRCAPSPPLVVAENPRHILIISLDTVRADALGPYGGGARTPAVDALAAEGIVFERHQSAAPTTLAAHTSLMTGQYPHTHGIPRNGYRLSDDNEMLAEFLQRAGFTTAAILGAMPLAEHANFPQGFSYVDDRFQRARERDLYEQAERTADRVTDATLDWLDREDRSDERLFLFVHYFDAHQPYNPPEPWRSMYGPVDSDAGDFASIHAARKQQGPAARHDTLRDLYHAEISFLDSEVGRLLDGLRSRQILDDALIILTADHGETHETHTERWDHGATVYDETVHTPLIVRLPGARRGGTRVDRLVSSVDVFPTVLDRLGVPSTVDGQSFLPVLEGEEMEPRRPVFAEATKPWDSDARAWHNELRWKTVREGSRKLHFDPVSGARELYDLAADPGELHDLLADPEADVPVDDLQVALDAWRAAADPLPATKVSAPDITAQLEALGYVE